MTENIAPIIWLAAFVAFIAFGAYKANEWRKRMRKPTLRELCRREYGDEFAEDYDTLCDGGVIGGFAETIAFIEMVEKVKSEHAGEWRNG